MIFEIFTTPNLIKSVQINNRIPGKSLYKKHKFSQHQNRNLLRISFPLIDIIFN